MADSKSVQDTARDHWLKDVTFEAAGDSVEESGTVEDETIEAAGMSVEEAGTIENERMDGKLTRGFHGADLFVTEGKTSGVVSFGTGVLCQDPSTWGREDTSKRRWVITAAHTVTKAGVGSIRKVSELCLAKPIPFMWSDFPKNRSKYKPGPDATKHLYDMIRIPKKNIHVHPNYTGSWNCGYDLALIAIPEMAPSEKAIKFYFDSFDMNNYPDTICVNGFPMMRDKRGNCHTHIPYYSMLSRDEDDGEEDEWSISIRKPQKRAKTLMADYPLATQPGISGGAVTAEGKVIGIHNAKKSASAGRGTIFTNELKSWIAEIYPTWDETLGEYQPRNFHQESVRKIQEMEQMMAQNEQKNVEMAKKKIAEIEQKNAELTAELERKNAEMMAEMERRNVEMIMKMERQMQEKLEQERRKYREQAKVAREKEEMERRNAEITKRKMAEIERKNAEMTQKKMAEIERKNAEMLKKMQRHMQEELEQERRKLREQPKKGDSAQINTRAKNSHARTPSFTGIAELFSQYSDDVDAEPAALSEIKEEAMPDQPRVKMSKRQPSFGEVGTLFSKDENAGPAMIVAVEPTFGQGDFAVGELVKLRSMSSEEAEKLCRGWNDKSWSDKMANLLGYTCEVKSVEDDYICLYTPARTGSWNWPYSMVEKKTENLDDPVTKPTSTFPSSQTDAPAPTAPVDAPTPASVPASAATPVRTTCPGNHKLNVFATQKPSFVCDTCRTKFGIGATLHGCRECDWDICESCVNHYPEDMLGLYRVCMQTIVRKEPDINSELVNTNRIMKDSVVNVIEIKGRFARIDDPVSGWCSLWSRAGSTILVKDDFRGELGIYRVCMDTIVRSEPVNVMGSELVKNLSEDTRVNVVEIKGRFARIDEPAFGWCVLFSSKGDIVLTKDKTGQFKQSDTGILGPKVVVELTGLKSEAGQKLNGKTGVIESFNDSKSRWNVLINGNVSSFKQANIKKKDSTLGEELYKACKGGEVNLAKILISVGADVSWSTRENGKTPVWVASSLGNINCLKCLAESGADLSTPDNSGRTPLYAAAAKGQMDCVRFLVDHGVDLNTPSNNGFMYTPVRIASERNHDECFNFLIKKGAHSMARREELDEEAKKAEAAKKQLEAEKKQREAERKRREAEKKRLEKEYREAEVERSARLLAAMLGVRPTRYR